MTEQIEQVMKDEIEQLDWMSAPTKAEALRKLHAIRNKIGYPDTWRDYTALTVKPDDYFDATPSVPAASRSRADGRRSASPSTATNGA